MKCSMPGCAYKGESWFSVWWVCGECNQSLKRRFRGESKPNSVEEKKEMAKSLRIPKKFARICKEAK